MRFSMAVIACLSGTIGPSAAASLLPLQDGTYVTDQSLCGLTPDQQITLHGDMIGAMVWNISGDQIDNSYETSCNIEKARRAGADLKISARCDSEDIRHTEMYTWRLLDKRSFQFRGRTYTLCPTAKPQARLDAGKEFILDQLRCVEPPNPAPALQYLVSERFIDPVKGDRFDSITCWKVERPFDLGGLPIASICAADERELMRKQHPDLFWRGPGTSAGIFLSVGTDAAMPAVEQWLTSNGVPSSSARPSSNGGAKIELGCSK